MLTILLVAHLLVFHRTVSFGILTFDDHQHLLENPYFQHSFFSNFQDIWTHSYLNLYIPLSYTAWFLLGKISGFNPTAFHWANVLLHFTNALLTGCFLRSFFHLFSKTDDYKAKRFPYLDDTLALLGALVFSLHPVQVETVSWISGFRDLLSTFFVLLGMNVLFLQDTRWTKRSLGWILGFLFLCAGLSKPNMLTS